MERLVKERLVGAAVLMAAAIILIPEMLGGPDRSKTTPANEAAAQTRSQSRSDAPIKTYTIDLSKSPGVQPVVTPEDNRAPPPEDEPVPATQASTPSSGTTPPVGANDEGSPPNPHPAPQAAPEPASASGVTASDRGAVARTTPPPRVVEPPTSSAPARQSAQSNPSPQSSERPLASGANAPMSGAWAVQLGSFSRQETAERLVKELQGKGHDAYVMPVKSGSATLYRVRIGPMKDRASAQATLQAVQRIAPGAAIVSQP